ncbi:MAG: hypothetical protein E7331_03500 [Clostridiales bacterium]|nr:hypothetical protein [Clostridiales bacterium]
MREGDLHFFCARRNEAKEDRIDYASGIRQGTVDDRQFLFLLMNCRIYVLACCWDHIIGVTDLACEKVNMRLRPGQRLRH